MYETPDYTILENAMDFLVTRGWLTMGLPGYYPSGNEKEAYQTILKEAPKDVYTVHPTGKIILTPKVGMHATLRYPNDSYPYEITKVISHITIEVREMKATMLPGWVPDFTPGGFHGHYHNLHERKYSYESDPNGKVYRVRLNKKGNWKSGDTRFTIGRAYYFIDWND